MEGLARVDVVCLDKTGTLTEGTIVFDEVEALDAEANAGGGERRCRRRSARWPTIPTATPPLVALAAAVPVAGMDAHRRGAVLVGPQVERSDLRRPRLVGDGCAGDGAHRQLVPGPCPRRRARVERAAHAGAGARATSSLIGESLPADLAPVALVMFAEKVRPDAAETLAYFAAQGVELRVISGDNPRTVAAVAATVGLESDGGVRRARAPRGPGRDGGGARAAPRVRPGHAAAEARDGRCAAIEGSRRRDDGRRRERRARAEGRRHRRRHGLRRRGDPRGRAARAPRGQVLDPARGRRRGAQGHGEHRAVGEPVRHQDRLRGAPRDHGVGDQLAVPVPAAPPHDRQRVHDRHPRLLPRAGAQLASLHPWLHRQGAALLHPGRPRRGRSRARRLRHRAVRPRSADRARCAPRRLWCSSQWRSGCS